MWHEDIAVKEAMEANKVRAKRAKNIEVSAVLKEQMAVLDAQRMEVKRCRNENAKLLKEKANIENLEKQLEFRKKREEQAIRRHELDLCVRYVFIYFR